MKVLQINAVYGFLSTGIIAKDICDMLEKNGEQTVVATQRTNITSDNVYIVGNKPDWKYHALHSRVFGKQGYASKGATKKLLKWMEKEKPDVVHLHNLHSNYINFNMLCDYLSKNDIPTVITLHDCWYFTGKCTHYVQTGCDRWQSSCGNCPQLKKEVPSLFFDNTEKVLKDRTEHLLKIKNLTLVGCSNWIAEEVKKSHLSSVHTEVVYNGVDTAIFRPHENNFRQKYNIGEKFVIMGMADKWSNPINKASVDAIIKNNPDAAIVVVGCKDEQKELFEGRDNVITIGFVSDRNELADIYSSADVFVNLTRADTLPTVNMESICCGTPVVTFDLCGSPELVDEDSGIVVAVDDVEKIVDAIESVKSGKYTFDVTEKQNKFDKNYCYGRYYEIYKSVL